MKYTVVLKKDEDSIYVATVPTIPCCISNGHTVEEALKNIKEAIQGFVEDMKTDGESLSEGIGKIESVEVNA